MCVSFAKRTCTDFHVSLPLSMAYKLTFAKYVSDTGAATAWETRATLVAKKKVVKSMVFAVGG
jgi:hypothetical protein